jgi:UDP-2,3-diacylglucosamine hydrolase
MAHGDGLGNGDSIYKFLKSVFSNKICQRLFSFLPSRIGIYLMKTLSSKSRVHQGECSESNDFSLELYAEKVLEKQSFDYFIFGHLHNPMIKTLSNKKSKYINLGDWMRHFTYAVLDDSGELKLKFFEDSTPS